MISTSAMRPNVVEKLPDSSTVAEMAPGPAISGMASGKAAMLRIMSLVMARWALFSWRS